MENSMELKNKLKTELPYNLSVPLLGIYPEKNMIQKDTQTPMFIAALFAIAKTWRQPKCPLTENWIQKTWLIYTMKCCCCLLPQSCPTLLQTHGLYPTRCLCPGDFLGKNTGVGCHLLLQRIFLTQGSNTTLLHCKQIL